MLRKLFSPTHPLDKWAASAGQQTYTVSLGLEHIRFAAANGKLVGAELVSYNHAAGDDESLLNSTPIDLEQAKARVTAARGIEGLAADLRMAARMKASVQRNREVQQALRERAQRILDHG